MWIPHLTNKYLVQYEDGEVPPEELEGVLSCTLAAGCRCYSPPNDNNHVAHDPSLVYVGTTQMAITMMLTQVIDNDDNN